MGEATVSVWQTLKHAKSWFWGLGFVFALGRIWVAKATTSQRTL